MVRKITPTSGGWSKRLDPTDPFAGFQRQATRALAAAPWTTDAWPAEFARRLTDQFLAERPLPTSIADAIRTAVAAIVAIEMQAMQLPDMAPATIVDAVNRRNHLRGLLAFKTDSTARLQQWLAAITAILRMIADAAPNRPVDAIAFGATAPLIDMISGDASELITNIVSTLLQFHTDDPHSVVPGAVLARRVKDLILTASRIPEEAARKNHHRLTSPKLSGLAGEELVAAFLPEPFIGLLSTPLPFAIPRHILREHGAIFSKSGHGKTRTLRAIFASLLQDDDPPAIFAIDSLGSLIEGVDQLQIFNTRLKDRLVIINPPGPIPSAMNLFALQSDDLIFYLFKSLDQSFTTRQATMFSYLMELARNIDGATLTTLKDVCESKDNLYPDVVQRLSPFARSFFEQQFYARKPDHFVQATKNQIAQRLYAIGRIDKFVQMFSARENKFDALRCMQDKMICIINTDARPTHLGGLGEASSILGRFILAQCLEAARSRPSDQRHLALIIADESKAYMDDQTALIMSDARQFGLGLLQATQFPHQLPEGVRRELNTNTSIKIMAPTEFAVAAQYARDMFTTPEKIMSMKSYDRSHAEWMVYVANVTNRAVKLTVPFRAIENMPRMTDAEHAQLLAINRSRYGITDDATPCSTPATTRPALASEPAATPREVPTQPTRARDFGKVEAVTVLGVTLSALLDTSAEASVIIATERHHCGTPANPRLSFAIATPGVTLNFERPIIGSRPITGMHGAAVECPIVALDITLDDYTALEHFAVTVDPVHQSQPIILSGSFFAAAPFAVRISPVDSMRAAQRRQRKPTRTHWDSDHGEAEEV